MTLSELPGSPWWARPSLGTWLSPRFEARSPRIKDQVALILPVRERCVSADLSPHGEAGTPLPNTQEQAGLRKESLDSSPAAFTASTAASTPMQHCYPGSLSPMSQFDLMSCPPSSVDLKLSLLEQEPIGDVKQEQCTSLLGAESQLWERIPKSMEKPPQRRLHLGNISCSLQSLILQFLHGYEAVVVAAIAPSLMHSLTSRDIWERFLQQEAEAKGVSLTPTGSQVGLTAYRKFVSHSSCLALKWHSVPCTHNLGKREGSPAVFCCCDFVFVYGGWSTSGPAIDLHVGHLTHPFTLRKIPIRRPMGIDAPPPTYEMKITVLADNAEHLQENGENVVHVAVTGGYLSGGYHRESNIFAILELQFDRSGSSPPTASWHHSGTMTPRSNHSATYISADVAGPRYVKGCLLAIGGNVRGRVVNTVDVLDLEDMTWEYEKATTGSPPEPRNSHSAVLMKSGGMTRVLVMGGCTGDRSNGGPPRGGADIYNAHWLHPQSFTWQRAPEADAVSLGRGHIAVKLCGTVVIIGGGRLPGFQVTAFRGDSQPSWIVEAVDGGKGLPRGRILGGGCALSDQSVLMYGGWHPMMGSFDDMWVAHVDGWITPFCAPLCGLPARETESKRAPRYTQRETAAPVPWCHCLKQCKKIVVKAWGKWFLPLVIKIRSMCYPPSGYDHIQTSEHEGPDIEVPSWH